MRLRLKVVLGREGACAARNTPSPVKSIGPGTRPVNATDSHLLQ